VESRSGGQNLVARIDPATNDVTREIPVDGLPAQLVAEDGSLWVGLGGSVQRLDPETGHMVAEIVGPGTFLTRTPGAVWALDSADSITRIDPTTNQVVATVKLDLPPNGSIASPPVGTNDAVWVIAGGVKGELFRIDPDTNSVVATIDVDMPGLFAVGEDSVWVVTRLTADSTHLTRIDTATNQAASPVIVEGQWAPFAVGAGRLWLMGGMQPEIRVAGFNLSTLELDQSIVVGELPAFEGSGILDPQTDTLWVSQYEGYVTRIDLTST
jgi:streptogramin lyase